MFFDEDINPEKAVQVIVLPFPFVPYCFLLALLKLPFCIKKHNKKEKPLVIALILVNLQLKRNYAQ